MCDSFAIVSMLNNLFSGMSVAPGVKLHQAISGEHSSIKASAWRGYVAKVVYRPIRFLPPSGLHPHSEDFDLPGSGLLDDGHLPRRVSIYIVSDRKASRHLRVSPRIDLSKLVTPYASTSKCYLAIYIKLNSVEPALAVQGISPLAPLRSSKFIDIRQLWRAAGDLLGTCWGPRDVE